jgi:diguanylate cyclase (GGDEF)-like protein
MAAIAEAQGAPAQQVLQGLDPYGQVIKMLLPRARTIAVYGANRATLWVAGGQDDPQLQAAAVETMDGSTGRAGDIDGFAREFDGATAYVFRLRDERGWNLAAVALLTQETGESRPFSLVLGLVRPALECLARELAMRVSLGILVRDLSSRDQDLELLLDASREDARARHDADELGRLVQAAVEHLDCTIGALIVPEKGIAVVRLHRTRAGGGEAAVVTRTHRHLMSWAQLQRRTMVVNKVGAGDQVPPFKILSVPVRHVSSRVIGFFALFNPTERPDYMVRHVRLAELLARKITSILQTSLDTGTGLATRAALESQVAALAGTEAAGSAQSVIYIDLDQLHVINENFGMHVGDEIIARVAEVLRRRAPVGTLIARIAGDRYALYLPDSGLEATGAVAEELRTAGAELSQQRGEAMLRVSLSAGVAELQSESQQPFAHALACAEIACKSAKDRGRNRVELYHGNEQSGVRRQTDTGALAALRAAIENSRFQLLAQPMLALGANGAEPRFEILLRMLAENGEALPPPKFMAAAERYQLMPAIDRWVIENGFAALGAQRDALNRRIARFAFNLSAQSLADTSMIGLIESQAQRAGIPADLICFELAESSAIASLERAEAFMQRLRSLGFQFALDDFGTGASSLAYLKSLPVSVLKIDGGFVRDALANPRSESMVKAIAQLAHSMGMTTVAEFVETDEIRLRMANLGVDYGQGFAIARPAPLAEVLQDLALYSELAAPAGGAEQQLLAG